MKGQAQGTAAVRDLDKPYARTGLSSGHWSSLIQKDGSRMREAGDLLNQLLIRWHRWTADPRQSTDIGMRDFDAAVSGIRPTYRVALILEARNLSCGAAVWSSTRIHSQRDRARARNCLLRHLAKEQDRWFGKELVHFNERGNRVGESNPMAALTDHEVDLMREMRDETKADGSHKYSLGWLAIRFKVAKSTVQNICSGRRRAQVPATVKEVTL